MKRWLTSLVVAAMGVNAGAVGGGGFANQVAGTRAMGMANAFSAVADDSSAVFFNPAGLTQLENNQVSVGAAAVRPSSDYTGNGTSTTMDNFVPVVPNFYTALRLGSGRVTVGFGMFAPYGLKTVWPVDGPFEYVTTESNLTIPQFSPTVAFKATDKVSVGAGLVYARGYATLKSAFPVDLVNYGEFKGSLTGAPDGEQIIEGDGYGYGANTGILVQPGKNHSLALTWRSEIKIEMNGNYSLKGLSNEIAANLGGSEYSTRAKTSITLPPSLTCGYAYKRDALTWAFDGEWVGYSSYRATHLEIPDASFPAATETRHEYKDAWSVSTGVNYVWNKSWQSRGGYSFYPAVSPETHWDPSVPDADTDGFHFGGSWTGTPLTVDLSYSYFHYRNRTIDSDVGSDTLSTVDGDYKTSAQTVSVNLTYNF